MDTPHFLYPFVRRWTLGPLPTSWPLWIMNNVSMNTGVQIFVQVPAFSSLVYMLRIRIAGSYGNFMYSFRGTTIPCPQLLYHFTFSPPTQKSSNLWHVRQFSYLYNCSVRQQGQDYLHFPAEIIEVMGYRLVSSLHSHQSKPFDVFLLKYHWHVALCTCEGCSVLTCCIYTKQCDTHHFNLANILYVT